MEEKAIVVGPEADRWGSPMKPGRPWITISLHPEHACPGKKVVRCFLQGLLAGCYCIGRTNGWISS